MHSVSGHCMKNKVPGYFYSIYIFLRPHGAFIHRRICTVCFCLRAYGSIISFKPAKKYASFSASGLKGLPPAGLMQAVHTLKH